jgi:hypothetical protein
MWGRFAALVLLASVTPTAVLAVNSAPDVPNGPCVITGAEKLHGEPIGSDTICSEIEGAIAAQMPTVRYSAQIKVLSSSRLAATLIVNGRTLPVQNFAVMDGKLSNSSVKRFASALAQAVAQAAKT